MNRLQFTSKLFALLLVFTLIFAPVDTVLAQTNFTGQFSSIISSLQSIIVNLIKQISQRRNLAQVSQSSYSATSPHFTHARFAATDYRIEYMKNISGLVAQQAEYDWATAHYDLVVGGNLNEWKSRNPTVQQYVYDLIFGERVTDGSGNPVPDTTVLENWLVAHGYPVENAYLHYAGGGKTVANRVNWTTQWGYSWAINPGDPGLIAWRENVTKAMTAVQPSGFRFEGLFYDGLGTFGMGYIPNTTEEYAIKANYLADLHGLLALSRNWMPSGRCIPNTTNYITAEDAAQADSCGSGLMDFINNAYGEPAHNSHNYIDQRIAAGTQIIMVTGTHGYLKSKPYYNMNAGNYSAVIERVLLVEYANYLMLLDPAQMDLLAVDFYLTGTLDPAFPHSYTWLKAFEVDIGQAQGKRSIIKSGTDAAGQSYKVYQREFANALALNRPTTNWAHNDYGDATAVAVNLPTTNTWYMLRPDGTQTGPVTSVQLRNAESAIFMKSGGGITPPPTPYPSVSIYASPTSINSGGASTITWSSSNTSSCSALWTSSNAELDGVF